LTNEQMFASLCPPPLLACVLLPEARKEKMQELQLEHAISTIRVRFGSQALTRAAELPPPQPWPSRTPLDRLSGIEGLPRGRLTLLAGSGTCGKLTLALGLLASATREFAHAVVTRTDWVWERDQLVGLRTIVRCLKNRVAPPLGKSELEIRYPLGPQLPFTTPVIEVPLHAVELECESAAV